MNRLITLLCCMASFTASAVTVEEGAWKLDISDKDGQTDIYKNDVLLVSKNHAVFKLDDTEYPVTASLAFTGANVEIQSDAFGTGKRVEIVYTLENPALTATHIYYLYSEKDYILTELKVESTDVIASNYMSPLTTTETSAFLPEVSGTNVALIVPFDNDAWVRYGSNVFRSGHTYTSYEAGCLYSTENNDGLVLGSIEHDNWKTGVVTKVGSSNKILSLTVYGGISDNYDGTTPTTRDQLPHGKVKGTMVKSPKIMLGYFDDWRDGMETYGELNAIVAPKRAWNKGTPFGWNSWGNAMSDLSYTIASAVSSFFAEKLAPEFSNDGTCYIGLDSYWTNITAQNRRRFVNECKSRGQKPGIYWTPFVDWGGDVNKVVEGTDGKYKYGDIMLKINGKPAEFPGGGKGWALDPTHIGTKMRIDYYIDQWIKDGYEYIKIDFMTHGTFEADSWYDPEITTGIQAYNQGMKYISDKIGDKMYINLSIAPLFPSQYANGRRYACDTYGTINDTKYALNALTHSWWTDRFYCYNDPDYMVFGKFEGNGAYPSGRTYTLYPVGTNRARYTSVVTSGLCLLGDDFLNCSDATRTRAQLIAKNEEINRIGKIGKSFRPVENAAWATGQADAFMYRNGDTLYVAAYHFASSPAQKTIELKYSDLGLSEGTVYTVHELWTDSKEQTAADASVLTLKVPRIDARVYKIYVDNNSSSVCSVAAEKKFSVYPNPCRECLFINKVDCNSSFDYDLYSIMGKKFLSLSDFTGNVIDVNRLPTGSYILVSTDNVTKDRFIAPFIKE